MKTLEDYIKYYYQSDYNCAETLLHAANDYYQLGIHEEDIKMMAGFGAGMYTGETCGALTGSIAAISKKMVETRAHVTPELKEKIEACIMDFQENLGGINCRDVKPINYTKEEKCLPTCIRAGRTLEKMMNQ